MFFPLWKIVVVRSAHQVQFQARTFATDGSYRLAVVGSGPAGLFTCASLLRRLPSTKFDVFDSSPVPFGLIRYGVAPDHQEVKNCTRIFDKMFESHRDRISLFCNVRIGSDLTVNELTKFYDAVLLSYGGHQPRRLVIPGATATNVISGSEFVSWYNGVPNAKAPLLDDPNAVIIGNGNVALDCARILSTVKSLRSTDVPSDVLVMLEGSQVKNIKIIGRRGAEDVSFTIKELREQFKLSGWNTTVEMDEEEVLLDGVKPPLGEKQCRFISFRVPEEVMSDFNGRVSAIRVLNKHTGCSEEISCGLLIYSIGYEMTVLDGIPVNNKGMISLRNGNRVDMPCGSLVYAVGWCARGPRGVIVDTQQESIAVADQIASDLSKKANVADSLEDVRQILDVKGVPYITWDDWKKLDNLELKKGAEMGKIREKILDINGFFQDYGQIPRK
ncbi:hypothetical protein DICVIV_03988 [Dictyocaulus viviparus]|uniref:NADPH:adrenodoxin oxidoreductase, mitochondrial n=1 Tax=Dictyocaulus viviparus TaxID=29172 RepID=A0A0D8Y152_DICVI|nr:hypothetical protein DICVIV_03988 [Dictyocaulus viviparus]